MQVPSTITFSPSLIDRFNQSDMALLLAVSSDDGIAEAINAFDLASRELLDAEPKDALEREHLVRFIGERFLLSENASPELKQKSLDRLVALATHTSVQPTR